jgi:UDP-N-acetylglucosamine 2-epimerase (non-hydrolysing)
VNSGQHYSPNMSKIFLKDFNINKIEYDLKLGKKKSTNFFINSFYKKIKKILVIEKPEYLIVQGDTNTCLLSAFAAKELKNKGLIDTKIVHIEAGLRSFDYKMPEETNRIIVDHISDILFPPTIIQKNILIKEGIKKPLFVVGSTIADNLKNINLKKIKKNFFLLTIHRFENVTYKSRLKKIINIMNKISKIYNLEILFPCHPNTQNKIKKFKINLGKKIKIIKPIDYKKFLIYLKNCSIVFSDSGGIQEEACILKKNLITFRNNTERPETIKINANYLSMLSEKKVLNRIKMINKKKILWKKHPYGNNVSQKIVKYILNEK